MGNPADTPTRPISARRGFGPQSEGLVVLGVIALIISALLPVLNVARRMDWSHGWGLNLLKLAGASALGLAFMSIGIVALGMGALGIGRLIEWNAARRKRR